MLIDFHALVKCFAPTSVFMHIYLLFGLIFLTTSTQSIFNNLTLLISRVPLQSKQREWACIYIGVLSSKISKNGKCHICSKFIYLSNTKIGWCSCRLHLSYS